MKLFSLLVAALFTTFAFADHHEEESKQGHDQEHQHVSKNQDHEHDEKHHQPHDHKAHHPEHKDSKPKAKK
ncbi:MAG: hypothetical protein AB7I27_09495 [Bacteriovoracaceae bacterium]